MSRLNLSDLRVESFSTDDDSGGVTLASESQGGCGTHSLNYATHCDCSGGVNCTAQCVEYSQATDIFACCG